MLLGITGGIASGKSTVTARLQLALSATVFDADAEARRLVNEDAAVRAELVGAFAEQVLETGGRVDRAYLRAIVFADEGKKRALEAILHPRIRAIWRALAEENLQSASASCLILDIPLLYETGAETLIDRVVVVGCRLETQLQRLVEIRQLEESVARRIIATQLPLSEKAARAQHVIWNDSSEAVLHAQIDLLAAHLKALAVHA